MRTQSSNYMKTYPNIHSFLCVADPVGLVCGCGSNMKKCWCHSISGECPRSYVSGGSYAVSSIYCEVPPST